MRQDFHALLVDQKIFEMVENENPDTLFRFGAFVEPSGELFEDGCESVFLNQVEQTFFRSEIVIEARQRHAGGAGEVAHRSAFVSFFAEDFGRVAEDFAETAVETSVGGGAGGTTRTSGSARPRSDLDLERVAPF